VSGQEAHLAVAEVELTNHQPLPPLQLPKELTTPHILVGDDDSVPPIYYSWLLIACVRNWTYVVAYTEIGLIMIQRRRER